MARELPEGARLELAHALAGDPEVLADLLEGSRADAVQAEPLDHHPRWRGCSWPRASKSSEERARSAVSTSGCCCVQVRDEVGDARVAVTDRRLQADRVEDELEELLHALRRHLDLGSDLLERRVTVELLDPGGGESS